MNNYLKSNLVCLGCGNTGHLIFPITKWYYCIATNEKNPNFVTDAPIWASQKEFEISDEPIGCPVCKAWGKDKFEWIKEE